MHPALFFVPGERLSGPELMAARLDGLVAELGHGYLPADTVEGPYARAFSLRTLLRPGLAACGPTAAWIHGARDAPPRRHHVRRSSERRLRVSTHWNPVFHDVATPPDDLQVLGECALTAPAKTLEDLVLGAHRHPDYAPWRDALAQCRPELVAVVTDRLADARRIPGRRRALDDLRTLAETIRTT